MSNLNNSLMANIKNICIYNGSSNNVMSQTNLAKDSLIICAPVSNDNTDSGSFSLIITDNNGNPCRLTYSLITSTSDEYNTLKYDIEKDNVTIGKIDCYNIIYTGNKYNNLKGKSLNELIETYIQLINPTITANEIRNGVLSDGTVTDRNKITLG